MLLDWKSVEEKMPWELVFLLGGGFALAKGTSVSGLSTYLGSQVILTFLDSNNFFRKVGLIFFLSWNL